MDNRNVFWISFLLLLGCQPKLEINPELKANPSDLEVFAEDLVSTPLYERDMAIAPDGKELIFTRGTFNQNIRALISLSKKGGSWGEATILPFSGKYQDIEPFYAPDGEILYFASNRPVYSDTTRTDYNIWAVNKEEGDWGTPYPLDSVINSRNDEYYPAVSANGNLYFTATRENGYGREDIFYSAHISGQYQSPIALDSLVNTKAYEFNAYIDPDETLLIFSSFGRADGYGGGDLYFSKKLSDGSWSAARNLGPKLNSEFLDYCPFADLKAGNLYFTSERTNQVQVEVNQPEEITREANKTLNGLGNIYRISLQSTPLKSVQ